MDQDEVKGAIRVTYCTQYEDGWLHLINLLTFQSGLHVWLQDIEHIIMIDLYIN